MNLNFKSNYKNYEKNIFEDTSYLEKFLSNLLTKSNYELKNRIMHINYKQKTNNSIKEDKNYTLEEQAIINMIRENPFIKQDEIANRINKSIRTVKSYMSIMQKRDY